MSPRPLRLAALILLFAPTLLPAKELRPFSDPGALPHLETRGGEAALRLPLEHTDVQLEVSGFVVRGRVRQRYGNPHAQPIEVRYVFPLPERAAVDDFRMVVGPRVIEGQIKLRSDARRIYTEAKRRGHTAALLEQDRPNIFVQSVANIPPGESIEVETHFVQTLGYDAGTWELVFPLVVGPRYHPGSSEQEAPAQPPVLAPGMRSGHDLSLTVRLDPGLPLVDFEVPTHEVVGTSVDDRLELQLAEADAVPNRDFILRWRVAGEDVGTSVLSHHDARGGFLALMLQPPDLDVEARVGQRELVFVVDVSGSMHGLPIWLCQEAMREALSRLRPSDTFNVITFAGSTARLFPTAQRASETNVRRAKEFVTRMQAGGGTEMLDAIGAALRPEVQAGRHRYVFFLTDGYVGNEAEIHTASRRFVDALDGRGQRARVFAYGVGSSPNRMLTEGLAEAGRGLAFHASNREDPVRGVDRFFRVVDDPILTDVSLDWGGLPVEAVLPAQVPDLFLSRPLVLLGRFHHGAQGVLRLRGRDEGGRWVQREVEITLPEHEPRNAALASLWARAQVHALESSLWGAGDGDPATRLAQVREGVERLGLEYRLLTQYTAFVAVDPTRQVGDGNPRLVIQPVEGPEDVDAYMAGATPWVASLESGTGVRGIPGLGGSGALGAGGLGMMGTGYGGGGKGLGYGGGLGGYGSTAGGLGSGRSGGLRFSVGQPVVMGGLDKNLIQRVVLANRNAIRYCYERALQRTPGLTGRVVLKWTIEPDGTVSAVDVVTDELGGDVGTCIRQRIGTWRFPSVAGGGVVGVSYPFRFVPAPETDTRRHEADTRPPAP